MATWHTISSSSRRWRPSHDNSMQNLQGLSFQERFISSAHLRVLLDFLRSPGYNFEDVSGLGCPCNSFCSHDVPVTSPFSFCLITALLPLSRPTTALKDPSLSLLPNVASSFPRPPPLPDLQPLPLPPTPFVITKPLVFWEDPTWLISTTQMSVFT